MDEEELRDLLDHFKNLTYRAKKQDYHTGRSGAQVFEAEFRLKGAQGPGYTTSRIVKIGKRRWADREREFFNSDFKREQEHSPELKNLVTELDDAALLDGADRVALAYSVSPNATSLGEAFEPVSYLTEEMARNNIEQLASKMAQWHYMGKNFFNGLPLHPHELLQKMLRAWRVDDIGARLHTTLPDWDQQSLRFRLGDGRSLWNPLPHLQETPWTQAEITYRISYPQGRIHGDLHTGNILCVGKPSLTSINIGQAEGEGVPPDSLPMLIDFGQTEGDGVPLFDFAYLEFDILQNLIVPTAQDYAQQWQNLLDYSMSNLFPATEQVSPYPNVRKAWNLIKPIREQVSWLLKGTKNDAGEQMRKDYETAWWAATVAVGLNYARKGETKENRPPQERQAALLYAAYGLDNMYALLKPLPGPLPAPILLTWVNTPSTIVTPLPPPVHVPAGADEQKRAYLRLLSQETPDRVDLSMLQRSDNFPLTDVLDIPLTEIFVWPKVQEAKPTADTLIKQRMPLWHNESTYSEILEMDLSAGSPTATLEDLSAIVVNHPCLVLLGDIGSGKTTFLKCLKIHLTQKKTVSPDTLPELADFTPVFIDLSEYASSTYTYPSLEDFLIAHFAKKYPGIDYQTLLLNDSKLLFLFDNLEALEDSTMTKFTKSIGDFSASQKKHRYIITSRIVDFDPQYLNRYSVYTLTGFTRDNEIISCTRQWCEAYQRLGNAVDIDKLQRRALRRIAPRDISIIQLTGNPLLLTIFIATFLQEREQVFSRFKYLARCVSALLDEWPSHRRPSLTNELALLRQHLSTLAYWMHNAPAGKVFIKNEITRQIEQQRQKEADDSKTGDRAEHSISLARREVNVFIMYDEQHYGFLFLALKEYLVAEHLIAWPESILESFMREKVRDPHWREVIRLVLCLQISKITRGDVDKARDLILNTLLRVDLAEQHSPYRLWLAGQCLADSARGDFDTLQNDIMDLIVETYLASPSPWLRALLSDVLQSWSDAPEAARARQTLQAALSQQTLPSNRWGWDGKVARRYQELSNNARSTEQKQLRFHIMSLLYQLDTRDNIATWINQVIGDLKLPEPDEVRTMAAGTLGILGKEYPESVKPSLLEAFGDQSWRVRSAAAMALGSLANIAPPTVHDSFIQDLYNIFRQKESTAQQKEAAIIALGQSFHIDAQTLRDILKHLLQVFEPDEISNNGHTHLESDPSPELTPFDTATSSPSIKRSSVLAVGQIARKQPADILSYKLVFDYLVIAINDEDSSVRQAAAIALGCLGKAYWPDQHKTIIHALQVARSDGYLPVIETAIRALEYLGEYPMPVPTEAFLFF